MYRNCQFDPNFWVTTVYANQALERSPFQTVCGVHQMFNERAGWTGSYRDKVGANDHWLGSSIWILCQNLQMKNSPEKPHL